MIYISHLLSDEDMKNLCEKYESGVEAIDFSIGEFLVDVSPHIERYEKVRDYIAPKELIFHGPFWDLNPVSYDSGIARVSRERYEAAYQAAKDMGVKKMIFHSCMMPDGYVLDAWTQINIDFWKQFLDAHQGITIAFENVLDRQYWPLYEIAKAVDHPEFGICLDIGHAQCYSKMPAEEWARELKPYINHLHIHDNFGDRDAHLALGEGSIHLKEVFDVLDVKNHSIGMTIENTSVEAVETSLRWMEEYMKK